MDLLLSVASFESMNSPEEFASSVGLACAGFFRNHFRGFQNFFLVMAATKRNGFKLAKENGSKHTCLHLGIIPKAFVLELAKI